MGEKESCLFIRLVLLCLFSTLHWLTQSVGTASAAAGAPEVGAGLLSVMATGCWIILTVFAVMFLDCLLGWGPFSFYSLMQMKHSVTGVTPDGKELNAKGFPDVEMLKRQPSFLVSSVSMSLMPVVSSI